MHIDTLNPNDPTCKQLAKEMWEDEQLEKDMDRDRFMTPVESVEYGLADEIATKRSSPL